MRNEENGKTDPFQNLHLDTIVRISFKTEQVCLSFWQSCRIIYGKRGDDWARLPRGNRSQYLSGMAMSMSVPIAIPDKIPLPGSWKVLLSSTRYSRVCLHSGD
jgi:hypothetical protein